jgi:hypothetical protein
VAPALPGIFLRGHLTMAQPTSPPGAGHAAEQAQAHIPDTLPPPPPNEVTLNTAQPTSPPGAGHAAWPATACRRLISRMAATDVRRKAACRSRHAPSQWSAGSYLASTASARSRHGPAWGKRLPLPRNSTSAPMNSPIQPRQLVRTSSVKGSSPNSPARVWSKSWSHCS